MEHYIKKLIREGEHQQLDFKFEVSDTKKIARSLVAFANTDGGKLLIGVKDNGKIVGVKSDEEAYMIETAAYSFTQPEVEFTVEMHSVEGKSVVEVRVTPSENKPHFAPDKEGKWTAYVRVNDENKEANKIIIKVWKRKAQSKGVFLKYTDAEKQILTLVEQCGEITCSKAMRVAQISKNKAENILANFIVLGILEPVFNGDQVIYQIRTTGNFSF